MEEFDCVKIKAEFTKLLTRAFSKAKEPGRVEVADVYLDHGKLQYSIDLFQDGAEDFERIVRTESLVADTWDLTLERLGYQL